MNKDRGIIKWLPFQSLTPTKDVLNKLTQEREKVNKPILSLEQQEEIEKLLIEAFYEHIEIIITYYQSGYILNAKTKIKSINTIYKKIMLSNNNIILFNQILKITM